MKWHSISTTMHLPMHLNASVTFHPATVCHQLRATS